MTEAASYERPDRLEDALALLAKHPLRVIAGCTDVFPATERKLLPDPVLDITGIAELRGIRAHDDGLSFGATTTWTDIARADLPPALHGLQQAAREVGALQIQNRGTLAGNLCNASPAADGVPPLLTLNAEVELASVSGTRRVPLAEFITGPRKIALTPNEVLSAVHIPRAGLQGQGQFLKLGARKHLVISIAMVAVRLQVETGTITDAACAIGACGPVASRLPEVEASLIGAQAVPGSIARITDADLAGHIAPIDDVRADARYRSESAAELLRRCLNTALDAAARGEAE